jgi:hypothetical protein
MLIRRNSQGGQATIFMVAALPLICGMVGLAFDIGYIEYTTRLAQTAADAGAIAGAIDLAYGNATAAARAGTAQDGFTNGSNGIAVIVNNPPAYGPHAGGTCPGTSVNCNFVEVIVQAPEPTFFLKMIGIKTSTTVAGRAVATSLAGDCIFALDPTASGALTFEPFSLNDINAPACALIVDSNSSSAVSAFLNIDNITTSQTSVVGGVSCVFAICTFTPAAVTGATPLADPLAYLPAPTPGTTCTGAGTALP